ncbi:MAG: sigma-54-dependent Fis family transcriptional regulator [Nitrospiraceae bacterium]|nr:MAG: sigma-54-dependent Fis family transcriptional regulator [Nitrospiraceae bacterium]
MGNDARILIVDDEQITLENLEIIMKRENYDVTTASSGKEAVKILNKQEFDVVLTDLRMDEIDGIQVLTECKKLYPDSEVIIITAYASLPSAIETTKQGAYYYLAKPFKLDEVRKIVREALEKVKLKKENAELREQIESYKGKVKIISQDSRMQELLQTAQQISPTDCNVIIKGESGTGKELFARFIHSCSKRAEGPFFAINCGAFTESILTSEMFGHEKGAFTGAAGMKKGLIEMASHGTLFLDEITEMALSMQVKLLRVVQEREVLRLGSTKPLSVDVRFVAATNRDIKELVKTGDFREDLYFRLNVVSITIPPLSDRRDDIPLLSYYFLKKFSTLMKKDVHEISPEVMAILMNYDFPGNVRELENIVERGVALTNCNKIESGHLSEDLRELSIRTFRRKEGNIPTLEEQETSYIQWVLKEVGGNKTAASHALGIDRVSLWRKLKKSGLDEQVNT